MTIIVQILKSEMPIKTIALIPCYNTTETITKVVKKTLPFVDMVIVVDNISRDFTRIAAVQAGADVLPCKKRGMGAATNAGIAWALQSNPDFIVTIDGDGQHDPAEIPNLLDTIKVSNCDIVVGIRAGNHTMPRYRKFGNAVIGLAYNLGAKHQLTDAQCGFRAFTAEVAQTIKTTESGFGCITEFLIKARKYGYRVQSVPVNCTYHKKLKENSTMNPIRHGLGVLFSTIKWRIWEIFS